jgi:hypothetical protein
VERVYPPEQNVEEIFRVRHAERKKVSQHELYELIWKGGSSNGSRLIKIRLASARLFFAASQFSMHKLRYQQCCGISFSFSNWERNREARLLWTGWQ